MAQDYDVTLKKLIDNFTADFARVVFGDVEREISPLDRELPATKHFVDEYDVIKLGELDPFEILHQKIVGLLPLVPLMRHDPKQSELLIREAVQQLNTNVDDVQLRAETFSALYLFSGLRQLQMITKRVLKEVNMLELLKKSEAYQEILSRGRQEGREEGRQEGQKRGEVAGVVRSILAILRARFGTVPRKVSLSLQQLDLKQLNFLVVKAMSTRSLATFEALLDKAKTKNGIGAAKH